MAESAQEIVKNPVARQLSPARLKLAEYAFNVHVADLEAGTTLENLLDEGFWAHVSAKYKPWDFVIGRVEDGSHIYFLMVLSAGRNFAKMGKLGDFDLAVSAPGEVPDVLTIKWRGPHLQWCVLRGQDVLKDKMTKPIAEEWLRNRSRQAV